MPTQEQDFKVTIHWLESSRAQRVLVLLEELNLKYDIQAYKRDKDGLAPSELQNIHPLGKSPTVVIETPNEQPLVLAESATEEWMRFRYFSHYIEGSLMSLLGIAAVIRNIQNAPVPFFIKPITRMISGKISESFLDPNFKRHFNFLESQLASSPNHGEYLARENLTVADIMIVFPLQAAIEWAGLSKGTHPKLHDYLQRMAARESSRKAEKRIVEATGSFKPVF
ncbi:putative glutathione S-transferase [Mollisia scopiformis]|uniref:Putative glutathione S-transferase n=1 Tax=Mollisia scopiformis TaxID=149040 RepID=A0A194WU94_MOLSC|nr:putative glutathione S-transferase [Mollisia scopiformis]KUJ11531.1 putative glutathione S-transferase [Mollisia scopiformis]